MDPPSRPIAEPENDSVIVSACDSQVVKISQPVRRFSKFWVKSQPYSLTDIFGPHLRDYVGDFVGGSILQAFLSAKKYTAGTARFRAESSAPSMSRAHIFLALGAPPWT